LVSQGIDALSKISLARIMGTNDYREHALGVFFYREVGVVALFAVRKLRNALIA
jgi:hypothetical protein